MKKSVFLFLLVLTFNAYSQPDSLIAHYPLTTTALDTTGNFDPMTLTNTPFLEGGIYCNGIYDGSGNPNYCSAITPIMPVTIFQEFSLSAKFKVDSIRSVKTPVLVGGGGWRWISCSINPDTTIQLTYNNGITQASTTHISLHTWHEFIITYDSLTAAANLYLDNVLACSASFTIIHGPAYDWKFTISDGGSGGAYLGYLKDVKIYSKALLSVETDAISAPLSFKIFPNPANDKLNLQFNTTAKTNLKVELVNVLSEIVYENMYFNSESSAEIDVSGFSRGIYFVKINDGTETHIKKVMIQ